MKNNKFAYHLINIILTFLSVLFIGQSFAARRVSAGWDTGLAIPALLGFLMSAVVIARLIKRDRLIKEPQCKKIIAIIIYIGIFVILVVEVILITAPMIHGPEQFPKQEKTWIIVLGCGIKTDGSPTWALQNRLDSALLRGGKLANVQYVVSGGQGYNEPISEGLAMADYLENHGVSSRSIIIEDQSTSTLENFVFSQKLMREKGWNKEPILFVTNDFHVFRARMLANRCGFTAYGIPAETPIVIRINSYLREMLALFKSVLFDWPAIVSF